MASGLLGRLSRAIENLEQTIEIIFSRGFPPGAVCTVSCNELSHRLQAPAYPGASSLKDILDNGFLWAVPKKRTTIEKRLSRRFGVPKYHWKPIVPKTNIVMCLQCGFNHQIGVLCGNCYEKIKAVTKEMQEKLLKQLKLEAEEKNVVTLYTRDETNYKPKSGLTEPKDEVQWFDKNLLQPTTQEPSDRTDVKPKDMV